MSNEVLIPETAKRMWITNVITIFISQTLAQDIVKHGIIFKHENSLLASHNAWKIFTKLDPKPFETLFQQVIRLEKNTNELKDSIFQFLKSDKSLQSTKDMHHKENKGNLPPVFPKLKSKFIIEDFDKKMAEIDKALGLNKNENRRRRALNNVDSSMSEQTTIKSTTSYSLTTSKQNKLYDGNYAMLNELPSLWTFLKELWQNHAEQNVTKQILSKLAKEKDYRQIINLKELKFSNIQHDDKNKNPIERNIKDTKTTTPTYESPMRDIQSSMSETTTNTVPEMSALNNKSLRNLTTLTYLRPTILTKWTWSTGPTYYRTQPIGVFTIGLRARIPVRHTEMQTIKVQAIQPEQKKIEIRKRKKTITYIRNVG